MLKILNRRVEGDFEIIEYTLDGKTVSHTAKKVITAIEEPEIPLDPQPSLEERILAETTYQTALLEMTTLGGL